MRRLLRILALALLAVLVLPPLYFAVVGPERPELPPAEGRVALSEGREIHVVERGAGPPVLLVHGLPGTAFDWAPLHEALAARGLRVIAMDRAGYGHSDPRARQADYTYEANAADVLALLEALELDDVTVVGWSYGGGTAIHAARRDPSRLRALVLVGSAGPLAEPPEEPPWIMRVLFSRPVLAWLRLVPPLTEGMRRSISEEAFSGQPYPDWWLPQLAANLEQRRSFEAWEAEGRLITWGDDLDPASIEIPVLVIHGDDDRFVPLAVAETLHARSRYGELALVEGGSHMLPVTHPGPLADAIAAFAAPRASAAE